MTHVATNLRSRRLASGLSQKDLAARSGISLRMIGAIEAGSSSASTATLDRLGMALNATLADLVSDPAAPRAQAIDRLGWSGPRGGEGVLRWSVEVRREVEVWDWRLQPGERYEAAADPQGWRVMLFVSEGRLTLEIGAESIVIEREPYLLDSARAHTFANLGEGPLRFFRCTCW